MTIVYFGPHQHSPAPELPADERYLWLPDFHLLRGFERDFWTSNPLQVDIFPKDQVRLWRRDDWRPLLSVADELLPGWREIEAIVKAPAGKLALMCEMAAGLERLVAEQNPADGA